MFDEDPNDQVNISGADLAIMCDEMKQLRAQILELQAALAAKNAVIQKIKDAACGERFPNWSTEDSVYRSRSQISYVADAALAIRTSDAELRKLVAKHVRAAQNEYFPFDYANRIERGEVEL